MTARFSADLHFVTDSGSRRVSVAVGSFAGRSSPSAVDWIVRWLFDPDFDSIDSVIGLAGFVADSGFDLCCPDCFATEIVAGPDPDFVRRRFAADLFCFVVAAAVASGLAFSSDAASVARFSF